MVYVIKVQFDDSNGEKQIRRLAVSSDVVGNYRLLKEKIQALFQFENVNFTMKWKDSDNDFIIMSSDDELAQALANADDGLLRVYLHFKNGVHTEPKTAGETSGIGVEHRLVTCDGCENNIFGARYKCLQCENYDLCSVCNTANKHSDHDMIKLVQPANVPREWVFLGSRKMWRSLFGRCPGQFFKRHKGFSTSDSAKSSPEDSANGGNFNGFPGGAFFNAVGHDFGADAQKMFTDAVQGFSNVLPGGIEVKVGGCPIFGFGTNGQGPNKKEPEAPKASPNSKEEETIPKQGEKTQVPTDAEVVPTAPVQPEKEKKAEVPAQEEEVVFIANSAPIEPKVVSAEANKPAECQEQDHASNSESACTDGWTFLQKEAEASGSASNEQARKGVHYPDLQKAQDGNIVQTNDPKIINALITMQAMGFTNEGGWLERLLVTKHGNINEALESLYPYAKRN